MKFKPATVSFPASRKKLLRELQDHGIPKREATRILREAKQAEVYTDGTYTVHVRRGIAHGFGSGAMVELSIKRNDREPIFDWRVMQEIKNELVGPECEGFQLFPAESRLMDTANQYWLYCFADPSVTIPVGFMERSVSDDAGVTGSKQRKLSRYGEGNENGNETLA